MMMKTGGVEGGSKKEEEVGNGLEQTCRDTD